MRRDYLLTVELLSDATFGRGDGVAGLVDQEVAHDDDGFPYIHGRTLKGLLRQECDNIVAVTPLARQERWRNAATRLFGIPGSTDAGVSALHVGHGLLSDRLRRAVAAQMRAESKRNVHIHAPITAADILASLTTIRRQTAIDPVTGVPDAGSLRSMRVVVRGLSPDTPLAFISRLSFPTEPTTDMLTLLVLGTQALRHVGSGRNRGRGRARCTLREAAALGKDNDMVQPHLDRFLSDDAPAETRS